MLPVYKKYKSANDLTMALWNGIEYASLIVAAMASTKQQTSHDTTPIIRWSDDRQKRLMAKIPRLTPVKPKHMFIMEC